MAVETERKFLVDTTIWSNIDKGVGLHCVQGYITNSPDKIVRIRVIGNQAFLTIKGKTTGISRREFEYEIPVKEGKEILHLFCTKLVEKTRYILILGHQKWEIDVFHGANEGLVVAEIELTDENEEFEKPIWLGKEVSHDKRYLNAYLLNNPYSNW